MPRKGQGGSKDRLADLLISKPVTARRAARATAFFTIIVTVVGAVLVRLVDRDEFPTIGTALWWAVQTVTTVGYGDSVPRNTNGRAIAAIVMVTGIGFLTVVTAAVAAAFIEAARERRRSDEEDVTEARLDEIITRLERIEEASSRGDSRRPD